ncbi:MAG: PBP1A family penicillin-binding protein [Candidatus Spechtbacterales bacterium]
MGKILKRTAIYFLKQIGKYTKKSIAFIFKNPVKLLKVAGLSAFLGSVAVAALFIYYSKDLPSPAALREVFVPESTKILDRTGTTVLYDIYGEEKRTIIAYSEMPEYVRNATIVAEDDSFYHHIGVDIKAIARAFLANMRGREIRQGGSTITQQFIKNALLTSEKTLPRKIKEAILAIELEWKYSKDEILELYLNQVPYGYNAYGIEAAAQTYFNKHAKDLTLAQSATLAALPQATTYYTSNLGELEKRKTYILNKMLEFGYINKDEYLAALTEEVEMEAIYIEMQAPHFIIEVKKYLEEKYGTSLVKQSGLRVVTTLDTTLQKAAEDAVSEYAQKNIANFNANNAALVAIDPKTGQVLAMVGSRDYFGESSPENCATGKTCKFDPNVNVALTPQQPGSSFKPLAYAEAFSKGYTPDTVVFDLPTEFNSSCPWTANKETGEGGTKCYNPGNYDLSYFGPITLKEALAQSRNVPAVKVLYLAGVQDTIELARRMGIESLADSSRYGLSLVLGGGDVTLLEETSAFGVFATRGKKNPPAYILRIEDREGRVLEEFRKETEEVLDKNVADQINYALSTDSFRERVFGENNYLNIAGLPIAVKTGTTQEYRDAWTVGYTPSLTAGVWVGNNNNAKMYNAPGSAAAAPIWNRFFREAYARKQQESDEMKNKEFYFALPPIGNEEPFVSPDIPKTGKAVLDGTVLPHSILRFVDKEDPLGPYPKNPQNDPLYLNWELPVQRWGGQVSITNKNSENISIVFTSPQNNTFSKNDTVNLRAEVQSSEPLSLVRILLDGKLTKQFKYDKDSSVLALNINENLSLSSLEDDKNPHEIIVEAENFGNVAEKNSFVFSLT